jgi:hypothetical protein
MGLNDIISIIIDKIPIEKSESIIIEDTYHYQLCTSLKKFRSGKPDIDFNLAKEVTCKLIY